MTFLDFQAKFSTEEQCRQYLFAKRWPDGFVCPKCKHNECFNIQCRNLYQCKKCNRQTSVTAGTIMDKTRTPLIKWFWCIYLVSTDKRGISALSLKKNIGVAYDTAWTMLHKIRHAMAERDDFYQLDGIVEMDDAFFGAPTEGGKRGRGTDKTPVVISVALTDEGKPKFAKIEVVDTVDGKSISDFAESNIDARSEIRTDGLSAYKPLESDGYTLVQEKFDPESDSSNLYWVHTLISNAKAFIAGTFHGLDRKHLQRYLDEFCYRFNRRWFGSGIFGKLVAACAFGGRITRSELIG